MYAKSNDLAQMLVGFAFRRARNSVYIPYSMCVLFLLFLVNDELELHCFHNRIIWFSANFLPDMHVS